MIENTVWKFKFLENEAFPFKQKKIHEVDDRNYILVIDYLPTCW